MKSSTSSMLLFPNVIGCVLLSFTNINFVFLFTFRSMLLSTSFCCLTLHLFLLLDMRQISYTKSSKKELSVHGIPVILLPIVVLMHQSTPVMNRMGDIM